MSRTRRSLAGYTLSLVLSPVAIGCGPRIAPQAAPPSSPGEASSPSSDPGAAREAGPPGGPAAIPEGSRGAGSDTASAPGGARGTGPIENPATDPRGARDSGPLEAPAQGLQGAGGHAPVAPPPDRVTPDGVLHTLRRGQTLYALSRAYGVPVATLMDVNRIPDPTKIPEGVQILVPGAAEVRSLPSRSEAIFAWPLRGAITSGFGPRGRRSFHPGLDIDGASGEPFAAAADGEVVEARRNGEYGLMIVIDHGGGLRTLYAHASRLLVKPGDRVRRGDTIGEVGRTGNARGAHLHFEVLIDGRPADPREMMG